MNENIKGRKGNGHKGKERRKGTGTLEKRGRVYFARWTVDGKRYSQSTGTADRREAELKLAEFTAPFQIKDKAERLAAFEGKLEGINRRIKEFDEARPALKLSDSWEAFLKSPNRKDTAGENRLKCCERWVKRLTDFMRENYAEIEEIRGIGKEHANRFAAEGLTDESNATRNGIITFFRMYWRVLIADETARIKENPWLNIQKKHINTVRRREMTVEELARVYSMLEGEMRLLFSVGIYTGQRLGDCALLEWGQIDLIRRRISIVPRKTARKTGRMVIIPIHENLFKMLAEIPAPHFGYVLPKCAKIYKERQPDLSNKFKRVFKNAGITTDTTGTDGQKKRALVSFHSLRHTFVSLAINAGVPIAVVQSIVGHSTIEMTRHYFHESEAALISAVAALPNVTGGAAAGGVVSPRLKSVYALVSELTIEERAELMRHLQSTEKAAAADGSNGSTVAAVAVVPAPVGLLQIKGA